MFVKFGYGSSEFANLDFERAEANFRVEKKFTENFKNFICIVDAYG